VATCLFPNRNWAQLVQEGGGLFPAMVLLECETTAIQKSVQVASSSIPLLAYKALP
jgi:hypothetical protein